MGCSASKVGRDKHVLNLASSLTQPQSLNCDRSNAGLGAGDGPIWSFQQVCALKAVYSIPEVLEQSKHEECEEKTDYQFTTAIEESKIKDSEEVEPPEQMSLHEKKDDCNGKSKTNKSTTAEECLADSCLPSTAIENLPDDIFLDVGECLRQNQLKLDQLVKEQTAKNGQYFNRTTKIAPAKKKSREPSEWLPNNYEVDMQYFKEEKAIRQRQYHTYERRCGDDTLYEIPSKMAEMDFTEYSWK